MTLNPLIQNSSKFPIEITPSEESIPTDCCEDFCQNSDFVDSETSDSLSEDTSSVNRRHSPAGQLQGELCQWAIKNNITHNAIDSLLKLLQSYHPELPCNARKLLETPRHIEIYKMEAGEYFHLGFYNMLKRRLELKNRSGTGEETMFALVKFLKEDSCEIVPFTWISADFKTCKWPGSKFVKRAIEKKLTPQENWSNNEINLIRCSVLYEDLVPKRTKYLLTSNLETSDEEIVTSRPVRKKMKIVKHSDLDYEFSVTHHTVKNVINAEEVGTQADSLGIPLPPIPNVSLSNVVPIVSNPESPSDSEQELIPTSPAAKRVNQNKIHTFEERVLRKLQQICNDISDLAADVRILKAQTNIPGKNLTIPGLPKFPLNTPDEIDAFTQQVRESDDSFTSVTIFLAREGDAVHVVLPTANCNDIEETMKSWLRNAKSRIKILPQDG
ncbi:unnamed protein product [Allacma fusca]|uniref:Uncharacterized protein n=1 Tax=Allacma fusca TaxID=39272 RepID=A0A8J2PQ80_9HEXA|nr:unnamed protein product [Allacma fusca]